LKIVADASVLIAFSTIRQLPLLAERFPQGILIPQAVWREVVEQGGDRPGAQDVAAAPWIVVLPGATSGISQLLQAELEEGEAEAIALAHALGAELVLLDERDARQAAARLGLRSLGAFGILIWAKQRGRLPELKPMLDALRTQGKFRISRTLYEQALATVGEL
jgi:predicted nucleic acid-binding protein